MKIIVDTNIVFSAILNTDSKIGNLLIDSENHYQFYTPDYLRYELIKHHKKLKIISKLTDEAIIEAKYRITKYIHFINVEIIPKDIWLEAEELVKDVDIDDIDFVGLTKYLGGYLWTGDKRLYEGLKLKEFTRIFNTKELWERRERLLNKQR